MASEHRESRATRMEPYVYRILAATALGLLATGTVVYRYLEDWSWVDSLYFSTIAITTVGFGDLTPSTDASKLFTIGYVIGGISIFMTFLNARLQRRRERLTKRVS